MVKRTTLILAALSLVIGGPMQVTAGVITFTSRSDFNAQGTIKSTLDFDTVKLDADGFLTPGDPFTAKNVTFTSGSNLIVGTSSVYAPVKNVIGYNFWSPIKGTIESSSEHFTMFGYDIGVLNVQSTQTLVVKTNKATYTFADQAIADATRSLDFRGFVVTKDDPGEFFTDFSITAKLISESLPGITDVTLGNRVDISAIPEPTSLALCGIAAATLAGYNGWRRRKQIAIA